MGYEPPTIDDYGSLTELTAGNMMSGPEDGGNKSHGGHHPSSPGQP